jgi:hypothetical protein
LKKSKFLELQLHKLSNFKIKSLFNKKKHK